MNDPMGSQWRKWDLHVHTPYSALNNNFPADFDTYSSELLQKCVQERIAVVGIADYFTIEGYKQLRAILADSTRLSRICIPEAVSTIRNVLFLPNIELRASTIVIRRDGSQSRVNFHVIFSDDITPEQIEEYFLREIRFTAESIPGGPDEKWPLTIKSLGELGKRLKDQHEHFRNKSDFEVGVMNAMVDHGEISEILERKRSIFENRYLICLPTDEDLSKVSWDGQGHLARKLMIQKSHVLDSANPGTRDFGLGHRHDSIEEFIREFKGLKPCIHGSDAHSLDKLFVPDGQRFTWIKADPTFAGLQMALREPEARIFIGAQPSSIQRIRTNKTHYIKSINFEKLETMPVGDEWLQGNIPLNPGLVCVIGNKGSGKSALTDCLGLLGCCRTANDFSFLKRFREKKTGRSQHIKATLIWRDGPSRSSLLSDEAEISEPERVKYLPQNFVEDVCNDISASGGRFESELENVIFSKVDRDKRLKRNSLKEVLEFRTQEIRAAAVDEAASLPDLAEQVASLESLLIPSFKASLVKKIEQQQQQIRSHMTIKPNVKQPPQQGENSAEQTKANEEELDAAKKERFDLLKQIEQTGTAIETQELRAACAQKLEVKIQNLKQEFARRFSDIQQDALALDLDAKQLVALRIDETPIEQVQADALDKKRDLQKSLDDPLPDGLNARKNALDKHINEITESLDGPQREYQAYLDSLTAWNKRLDELNGSADSPDTLLGLQAELSGLANVPTRIQVLKEKMLTVAKKVHELRVKEKDVYSELYASVQKFVDGNPLAKEQLQIEFRVELVEEGVVDHFLSFIDQSRSGSFRGKEDGRKIIGSLLDSVDWCDWESVSEFLIQVDDHLHSDKRPGKGDTVMLNDQIKQGQDSGQLFSWLYGLGYLKPQYVLQSNGKRLEKLSPGERGTLLLVFYLFVDESDLPLIIDQPEANLDNETVAQKIVECIRYARDRRQVVIVTHNPNLAVVCDADQVIHASLNIQNGHRITYTTGALEDPAISKYTINVLEGGRNPFDKRNKTYRIAGL